MLDCGGNSGSDGLMSAGETGLSVDCWGWDVGRGLWPPSLAADDDDGGGRGAVEDSDDDDTGRTWCGMPGWGRPG